MADSQRQNYVLGGSTFSAARLDLQYFQFIHALGSHHVDPSIDYQAPNLKIADICCGTGLWLISLEPHPTTELHALDINISNLPPETWFPNLKRHIYNVNDPPPESLVSYFDIINIQQAWTFIADSNFDAVFANIIALLKPGGHIQWTEFDPRGVQAFSPDPQYEPYAMVRLFPEAYEIMGMELPRWPWALDEVIGRNKVEIVRTIRPDVQWKMLRSWTRQQMTTWEEVMEMFWRVYGSSGDEKKRKQVGAFEQLLIKAREEATVKECSYFEPIVRVVGRKRLT